MFGHTARVSETAGSAEAHANASHRSSRKRRRARWSPAGGRVRPGSRGWRFGFVGVGLPVSTRGAFIVLGGAFEDGGCLRCLGYQGFCPFSPGMCR